MLQSYDLKKQVVNTTLGKVTAKGRKYFLASMPLHHGVGGLPCLIGCAPLVGYQVHNEGGLSCESVPYLVCSSTECTGECLTFIKSWACFTFVPSCRVDVSVATRCVPLFPITAVSEWQLPEY